MNGGKIGKNGRRRRNGAIPDGTKIMDGGTRIPLKGRIMRGRRMKTTMFKCWHGKKNPYDKPHPKKDHHDEPTEDDTWLPNDGHDEGTEDETWGDWKPPPDVKPASGSGGDVSKGPEWLESLDEYPSWGGWMMSGLVDKKHVCF